MCTNALNLCVATSRNLHMKGQAIIVPVIQTANRFFFIAIHQMNESKLNRETEIESTRSEQRVRKITEPNCAHLNAKTRTFSSE